jgi:hypothetical protein
LNVEKESIPDLFGLFYFLNNGIDLIWCMKNDHVCVLFLFNIRLHVLISYNELYEKLLFSMQTLCIGIYIKPGEMKFTTNFGYLEHPDISQFFLGPSNFEIEVFYCICILENKGNIYDNYEIFNW